MTAQSIVRNHVDDESLEEAYDRIKRQVIANAYAELSKDEKVSHWISYGKIPTPEEEPDANMRWRVTYQIPAERITRLLTQEEEPRDYVRWLVANKIPAERITRLLTQEEEPDAEVRWRVAYRIPAELLTRLLTQEEEPDANVRRTVSNRML